MVSRFLFYYAAAKLLAKKSAYEREDAASLPGVDT
jgi:hypothetical protein